MTVSGCSAFAGKFNVSAPIPIFSPGDIDMGYWIPDIHSLLSNLILLL